MRNLFAVSLAAAVGAAVFAPAAQAAHHHRMMKPAPMAMMAPMNPRVAPNGDFYATPMMKGDPMGMMMSPLAVPGAVVGGVTQPLAAGGLPLIPNLTP